MTCVVIFSLIDEGGDWDRRNRLKVYRGIYCMSIRDFKQAATLFLDTVATFTSYELMDYQTFVTYTVLCSMIALERPELREKVRGLHINIRKVPLCIFIKQLYIFFMFPDILYAVYWLNTRKLNVVTSIFFMWLFKVKFLSKRKI